MIRSELKCEATSYIAYLIINEKAANHKTPYAPTAISNMASKAKTVVQKLHAVTQVKSCIGRPWWEKRTIKALGFSRLHQTIIHKNIPTVNGALRSVKHLLEIKPVEIVEEDPTEGQRNGQEGLFLRQNGHFHLNKFKNFLENNPDMKEMIYKRKKQAIWERRKS